MKRHDVPLNRLGRWRLVCLLALAAMSSGRAAQAADAADAPAAATPEKKDAAPAESESADESSYVNYARMSLGGNAVSGNVGEFQRRTGLPQGVYGGVEDFHYERALSKKTTFKMDGYGIFGNADYGVRLEVVNPDKGFVRAGYRQFRTYFNGDGGYFPGGATPSQQWIPLSDNEQHLDHSEVWVEAGLTLPDWPEITFGYSHQEQEGEKSSTIWGPAALRTVNGTVVQRSILPTFYTIDETRDLFRLDARKSWEKVDVNVGLRYDMFNANNSRFSSQSVGAPLGNGFMSTQQGQDANMFNVHASAETRLRENLMFTVGYAYTDLKNDVSGYRVYGTTYDPDLAQRLPNPNTFQDMVGQTQWHQNVANLNFMWTLAENLFLVPSLRLESTDRSGGSLASVPAEPFAGSPYQASSDRGLTDVYESLDLRYTGLQNWVFYARGQWMEGWGDLTEAWANLGTSSVFLSRTTDDDRWAQKYSIGANWYPVRQLQLGLEYFYKQRVNDYSNPVDSTSNLPGSPIRYPAYLLAQQFDLNDVNARVTWRPRPNLTLVVREDVQWSTIQTQPAYLGDQQTADTKSYLTGASVSWTPWSRLYLQANLNYVIDETTTPAADISLATPSAENDYWTVTTTAGFVVDNDTDLQLTYTHYRADNYIPSQWVEGLPYGAGGEEDVVSASLMHRFSKRVSGSLRYAFFNSKDETSGGNNDFQSQMVYASIEYRF